MSKQTPASSRQCLLGQATPYPCGLQQTLLPESLPGLILRQVGLELTVVTQDNPALTSINLKQGETHAR